jgi:preprotein translocase subunit SecA
MNRQREVIYDWRGELLDATGDELVEDWIELVVADTVEAALPLELAPSEWDWELLQKELTQVYPSKLNQDGEYASVEDVIDAAVAEAGKAYETKTNELGPDVMRQVERQVILSVIDNKWREHLSEMDYLRAGIGLRAMGQRDPLVEYQREGYSMFSELVESVKRETVRYLFHVQLAQPATPAAPQINDGGKVAATKSGANVGRNDPCPCGSGKKYKRCHGAAA